MELIAIICISDARNICPIFVTKDGQSKSGEVVICQPGHPTAPFEYKLVSNHIPAVNVVTL